MSSATMLSLTDSELVTSICGLGVASTCERRAGKWKQSAVSSTWRCESVSTCCTSSQVLAVAVDDVGAENFRWW